MVKADLHIHTTFSEYPTSDKEPFRFIGIQDCYVRPEEAYKTAKKNGMDFVGITDHHSIEAALYLDSKYPDIIVGEELDVKASDDGHIIHLLVYNINEKQHNDLSDLRNIGVKETCEYTRKNGIIHSWAHPNLSPVKAVLSKKLIDELMNFIDRVEVKNGFDTRTGNNFAKDIAKNYSKKISGGSDAHIKSFIGDVFTHNNSARNKFDFLEALKEGEVEVSGLDMNLYRLQKQIYVFAYQSLIKDIFLNPHKRDRKNYEKYFLDQFLTLTTFSPLLATVLPSIFISYLHKIISEKRTSKFSNELTIKYLNNNYKRTVYSTSKSEIRINPLYS